MGIGIDGEVGIGQRTADIDVSASEVFDHLEFGAMGSYRCPPNLQQPKA